MSTSAPSAGSPVEPEDRPTHPGSAPTPSAGPPTPAPPRTSPSPPARLDGRDTLPVFVFLHGYATTPGDLWPLAAVFHEHGHTVFLPTLVGHDTTTEGLAEVEVEAWRAQVRSVCAEAAAEGRDVYVVGFSLGAALALDVAAELPIAGVVAISTFVAPTWPRASRLALGVLKRAPWLQPRRRYRTTLARSRQHLRGTPRLPADTTQRVLDAAPGLCATVGRVPCPVLLIHSLDDQVASYAAVADLARTHASERLRLVTLHALDHYVQFDLSPRALRDLSLRFFGLVRAEEALDGEVVGSVISELASESRHWSGILFQIMVGFFSLFGTLLAFTLPEVLTSGWIEKSGLLETLCSPGMPEANGERCVEWQRMHRAAPYYLIAYSLVTDIYGILLSLYFFYLNRVDTYIRLHIDPVLPFVPWVHSRTLPWAMTKASKRMTSAVAFPVLVVPFTVSLVLQIFVGVAYVERLTDPGSENLVLIAAYLLTAAMWLTCLGALLTLNRHSSRVVYGVPPATWTSLALERGIARLLSTTLPGHVVPPPVPHGSTGRETA